MDSSSYCSTTLSSEHSSLQSDKILLSSSTSATMQICCNMRSDAWYFKNAPQTLRTSVKKKLSLLKFAVLQLQNEKPLWKRKRGQFIEEQKGVIRRKSNKTRKKSRCGLTFLLHHNGAPCWCPVKGKRNNSTQRWSLHQSQAFRACVVRNSTESQTSFCLVTPR